MPPLTAMPGTAAVPQTGAIPMQHARRRVTEGSFTKVVYGHIKDGSYDEAIAILNEQLAVRCRRHVPQNKNECVSASGAGDNKKSARARGPKEQQND